MTTTPRPLTPAERDFYQCPDWCERWDHDADVVTFDHPPMHFGPQWEHISIEARGAAAPRARVWTDTAEQEHDAAGLRQIAADALAAAEWMESRR